jgi:hypothetical protein
MGGISHTVYEQVWKLPAAMRIPVSFCICSLGWFTPRSTAGFRGTIPEGFLHTPWQPVTGALGLGLAHPPGRDAGQLSRSRSRGRDLECDQVSGRPGNAPDSRHAGGMTIRTGSERTCCGAFLRAAVADLDPRSISSPFLWRIISASGSSRSGERGKESRGIGSHARNQIPPRG